MPPQPDDETATERSDRRWQKLIQNISDAVTVIDPKGRVLQTSGQLTELLGYTNDDWVDADGMEIIHPDDRDEAREKLEIILSNPDENVSAVLRTRTADGDYADVEYTVANLLEDPDVQGIILTGRNITDHRRAQALLSSEAGVLKLIAQDAELTDTLPAIAAMVGEHTSGQGEVFVTSTDEAIVLASADACGLGQPRRIHPLEGLPAAWLEQQFERAAERSEGLISVDLEAADLHPVLLPRARKLRDEGFGFLHAAPIVEQRSNALLGVLTVHLPSGHGISDHEREVLSVACDLASIAIERNRAQRALERQARYNSLTGLPNRQALSERLDERLRRAAVGEPAVAVLFVDLDRFKVINDSYGHAAGDQLIERVGRRLSRAMRPGDFLAHFGADEFVVLIDEVTNVSEALMVGRRIELALEEPFTLSEGEVYLSASIGVALAERDDSEQTLMQHADAAMYRAKDLGRDRVVVFDHMMRREAMEHLAMDRELRLALERYEFELYYQPTVDMTNDRVVGVEALIRWNHPERGLVLPGDFVPVAEDTGLILRIGRWVLEEAVRQARLWFDSLGDIHPFSVGVNLSARQLADPELLPTLRRVLRSYDWPAQQLLFELTETVLVDEQETTTSMLEELSTAGVQLAIDDFGTGYSSLSYLHRFPVDVIKIDRAFVADVDSSGRGSPVASAVVHVANELDLVTCAEGVEQPQHLSGVKELGCDWAQGNLLGRPVPAQQFEALLAEQQR